ncbi:hypothetical protein BGW36DRAFT_361812 [Talaromyces proteolyticus]|uniref:Uncharacterized protein n=1 Tax=Talaromyces proteolyticus TaxID=1131652 RepID=A0AAD4KJY3_9EURO|nr:uncharacterized protein BGW36DRAFT_361812 [Talaromyces proteolyticus]KAH8693991.1 hypothetical protein BGW36DRAFT_361812 [Talaromyces proteolyticus]
MSPKEWTQDPADMFSEDYWGADSPGQEMAKEYNLPSPRPFLGSTAKSPNTAFVFESNGAFYIWSAVVDTVSQITDPKGKEEIIQDIVHNDMRNLKTEQVHPPK